jgi:hypothetical protein
MTVTFQSTVMKKKNKHQTKITKDVEQLLNDIDGKLLSRFLRDMLIDYLQFNKDGLPVDFDISLYQLSVLFKVLDVIDQKSE